MTKLRALLCKELLVLLRDPVGLVVIFLMPLMVLLIVTLVQDGAFKKVTQFSIKAALVDEDRSATSQTIGRSLAAAEGVILLTEKDGQPLSRAQALELVRNGEAQVFVVLPQGLGQAATAAARCWAGEAIPQSDKPASPAPPPPAIETHFDPGVPGPYRVLVTLALQRIAQGMEFELDMRAWGETLPEAIRSRLPSGMALPEPKPPITPPTYRSGHAVAVAPPTTASPGLTDNHQTTLLPEMVQFNVPAYTVFAMFFIVIPISTCLLRERHEGTLTRMLTMSVRPSAIIAAKMLTFLGVALVQFCLMMAAGHWLLPALGTPAFAFTASLPALALLTLATSFAAVGFAIAVASTATSQEQAGMLGATSVVILAALGGVMVPVLFMPPVMQRVSGFTPLNWSVTAYQDIFARGASLADIQGRLLLLGTFGGAGLVWAWRCLFKRR